MKNYFLLESNRKNIKNQSPLAFIYYLKGEKKKIKKRLGYWIESNFFDSSTQRVKRSYNEYKEVNDLLNRIEISVNELIKDKGEFNITTLDINNLIEGSIKKQSVNEIINNSQYLDTLLEAYIQGVENESTKDSYNQALSALRQFQEQLKKRISIKDVDKNGEVIRTQFVKFQKEVRGNKGSTIVIYLERLNTIINRYNKNNKDNIQRFEVNRNKLVKGSKDIIHLDKNEISILYNLVVNGTIKNKYVIEFLFRCFTGMRFSEMKQLKKNMLSGDTLTYYQTKVNKTFSIPLFEQAKILASLIQYKFSGYNNAKERINCVNNEANNVRKTVKRYINERVIYVTDEKGNNTELILSDCITTHSARKSFATMIYNHSRNIYLTSKFLNHSDVKETIQYLRIQDIDLFNEISNLTIGGEKVVNNTNVSNADIYYNALSESSKNEVEIQLNQEPIIVLEYSNISLKAIDIDIELSEGEFEIQIDDKYKLTSEFKMFKQGNYINIPIYANLIDIDRNINVRPILSGNFEVMKL